MEFKPQEWHLTFNDRDGTWRSNFRLRRRLTGIMLLAKIPNAAERSPLRRRMKADPQKSLFPAGDRAFRETERRMTDAKSGSIRTETGMRMDRQKKGVSGNSFRR